VLKIYVHSTHGRTGISKLAVPVAIIVVIIVAGAYLFLARSSTAPPSSSASSLPTVPVSAVVNQLIQDFNSRNVDGLVTFYGPSAVDHWSGNTGGLSGLYTGPASIRLIYAITVGKSTSIDANISNYAEDTFSPTNVNATFVINLVANSTVAGIVTAAVDASQEWNWGNGGWQISKENWVYTHYDSSYIDAGHSYSSTTFPQWGYELKGGNPNLVSEKSFEWHAGPYVAASVYAFLFGVVAVMALRFRSMSRAARPGG